MKKRVRLTQKQKVNIINAYQSELVPMAELGKQYGVSRQAIYKILRKAGVDTRKQRLPVSCTTCGKIIYRTKSCIRKRKNHFCTQACYSAYLKAGYEWNLSPSQVRVGNRLARHVVSKYFQLQKNHVVHHEDHNQLNNHPSNLRVFACQGDHIRYHRGFDVDPIWDGRYIET